MTSGHVLELTSLPESHPMCGAALLHQCGPSLILRLSIDPTRLANDIMSREVSVNWLATPGSAKVIHKRTFSWVKVPVSWKDLVLQWAIGVSSQRQTEDAAIAVAVLLHDLAHAEIVKVEPIGSGGDYLMQLAGSAEQIRVECSGVTRDPTGSKSRKCLKKKRRQVLKKCDAGFVSVTTFSHSRSCIVHSYLHRVCRDATEASH